VAEPADPWDARSLEWLTPNPTPHHNFDEIPIVTHLDELWHRKYAEDESGRPVAIASSAEVTQAGDAHPHLPAQSYWPVTLAFALPVIAYGIIFNLALALVGALILIAAVYGWVLEPAFAGGHGGHGDDHDAPTPSPEPTAAAAEVEGAGDASDETAADAAPATNTEEETPVG
jgi:cytochrome c oxidase subunit 1